MSVKSVSIRIEEEMLQKIAYVADYEGRSVNSHILVLVRDNIKKFEEDNGKISIGQPIDRDENVKPAAKNKLPKNH
ncbi:MAG: Arc family DNA-binding protein [Ruminococcus sp.]|nr:Arc family DNA-binding protein [Ruminococcus sp.]